MFIFRNIHDVIFLENWILFLSIFIKGLIFKTFQQISNICLKRCLCFGLCFLSCSFLLNSHVHKWGKVFKNGPSKICERQPLKNLK